MPRFSSRKGTEISEKLKTGKLRFEKFKEAPISLNLKGINNPPEYKNNIVARQA
jgi:hypothetical protein